VVCLLPVAYGLKTFSITGAFIWPPTIPHLSVNALNVSGAVVVVCLLPVAYGLKTFSITGAFIWPPTIPHLHVNIP
jgi:uncharacterized RmlC-like cupin family protein